MNDRTLCRQKGSAGLPITIVLWCLSAGGVATFVAPAFDADAQAGVSSPVGGSMLEPVADVVALDDRRGLRRSLNELLPDYLVEVGVADTEAPVAVSPAPGNVTDDESLVRGGGHRAVPKLTTRVSIKAPALVSNMSPATPSEAVALNVATQPQTQEVTALVKSVGQPVAEPAYVAVPTPAPAVSPAALEPQVRQPLPDVEVADPEAAAFVDAPSPTLESRVPAVAVASVEPVCASAPTCLAQARRSSDPAPVVKVEVSEETPLGSLSTAPVLAQPATQAEEGLLVQVTRQLREGDHAGAYQLFRKQLRSGRSVNWSGRSLELYAISALGAGAYREAAISYERLIDAEPHASKWWLGLAASRQAIGQDASELFARAAVLAQPSSLVAER